MSWRRKIYGPVNQITLYEDGAKLDSIDLLGDNRDGINQVFFNDGEGGRGLTLVLDNNRIPEHLETPDEDQPIGWRNPDGDNTPPPPDSPWSEAVSQAERAVDALEECRAVLGTLGRSEAARVVAWLASEHPTTEDT